MAVILRIRHADLADPPGEPARKGGVGLVSQPEPGELDHALAQKWVARFGDALLAMPLAAGKRNGREPSVGSNLLAVGKGSKQPLAHQHGRQLVADAAKLGQQSYLRCIGIVRGRLCHSRVALGLDGLDLLQHEFQPLEFTVDFSP